MNGNYEDVFPIPKYDLNKNDIEDFEEMLKGYLSQFDEFFFRSEARKNLFKYTIGQFSELERKSIEPMALNVEEASVRGMQRFISESVWDDELIIRKHRSNVNEDMGDQNGILMFDETGFPKKGKNSVGVAKQYCGRLGKVENCQVGVFAGYASSDGYAFLDKRLFIPEAWFNDDYKEKREKCIIPEGLTFKTKPQLAAEMLQEISNEKTIPFKYVVADSIYGNSPDFVNSVSRLVGVTYFLSISSETLCWLRQPVLEEKVYKYGSNTKKRVVLRKGEKTPISVKKFAGSLHDNFWYKRKVSEGTKGPIEYEFSKRKITLSKNGLPVEEVWLIMKRTLDKEPIYSYYISNAPVSTRLPVFVWLSGARWSIEQCFEEGKSELGMSQYEVRKYRGWHHHILVTMLSHFFLWHMKIKLGKKSSSYYRFAG